MIRVGITGSEGLIGWHVRSFLLGIRDIEVVTANRATFNSKDALAEFVSQSDVIVHLAGMNRGDDQDVFRTNVSLTERLIEACERNHCCPHIIFSSSTHIHRDTLYGKAKLRCGELFSDWAGRTGAIFTNLILPHVFGENGKPFYNSAVSTFCYQLANRRKPEIINDGNLNLIHAQQVALRIFEIINKPAGGEVIVEGYPITVSGLLTQLSGFAQTYEQQIIPDLSTNIDLYLFNTYRSYLYPNHYPIKTTLHEDNRGSLFEAVKTFNGGQCFISTTKPGVTRGNHYHLSKVERFFVLSGQAIIGIRKLFSDEVIEFTVSGDVPQYIDIPTMHTHNITNVGSDTLVTLFWSHEIFNPQSSDTFPEKV